MKKFLFVVLGLVVLLLLGVVIAGMTTDVIEYENRVVIDRPVEQVWAAFTDVSRLEQWMTDLDTIENVSGEHLEVGSQWRLVFDEDVLHETVTAVEPPNRYAFDMRTNVFEGDTDVSLAAVDGGTELTSSTRVVGSNPLLHGMFVFMESSFHDRTQEQFERFAAIVEGDD